MSRGEFLFYWPQMSPWKANASYFSYSSSENVVWLFWCYWHRKGNLLPQMAESLNWTKTHQNWFRINQANISILDSPTSNQIMPGASCWVPKCVYTYLFVCILFKMCWLKKIVYQILFFKVTEDVCCTNIPLGKNKKKNIHDIHTNH